MHERIELWEVTIKERKSKSFESAIRYSVHHLSILLILIAIVCAHFTMVATSSSDGYTGGEIEIPEKSIYQEIASMVLLSESSFTVTDTVCAWYLFVKTHPELANFHNDKQYFQYIYKEKEHADLDIKNYTMEDIKYRIRLPNGLHSLRILDSSSDEAGRKHRNRVFVKLLHSFYMLKNHSIVIENIKIKADEHELLKLAFFVRAKLITNRLTFRNVTTETIRIFFRRITKSIKIGRLCIENCAEISLNRMVTSHLKAYEIRGLELTNLDVLIANYQGFLEGIKHLEHLKIHIVRYIPIRVVSSLLSILEGTLEIGWGIYEQVPIGIWADYAQRVTKLHLIDIEYMGIIQPPSRCISYSISSIENLTLSVLHVQPLNASILYFVVAYVKKYYRYVSNVVIMGRIDLNDVKSAVSDKNTELSKLLLAHPSTYFTFADSTGIDTNRKHFMFIPLSLYNKTTIRELGNRIGMLTEIGNWKWDKQEKYFMSCQKCKARKDVYVIQNDNGETCCEYQTIRKINQRKTINSEDTNIQMRNTPHTWYPRNAIFLQNVLGNRLYLAETRDILKIAQENKDKIELRRRKRKAKTTIISNHVMNMQPKQKIAFITNKTGQQEASKPGISAE